MKASETYFVTSRIRKTAEGVQKINGQFIVNGSFETGGTESSGSSSGGRKRPPIDIRLPDFEVKWILPPKGSSSYNAVKAFAEGAGYDTVEHDDFSYPPQR